MFFTVTRGRVGGLAALVAMMLAAISGAPASAATETALSGTHFGAASTAAAGGGIYQDVALNTSPGQTVCGSAWLRTEGAATGASGSFVLWLTGGADHESGVADYDIAGSGLTGVWTPVQTCVEATTSHTTLRIQFYPDPGSPTVEIDDVDVHQSLAINGSFENGGGPWTPYPDAGSNYSVYSDTEPGDAALSGSHVGATNAASAGGGIYEDVPLSTTPGDTVCGSAWLRTEGTATGASGSFALWLTGGSDHEAGVAGYSGLGNGGDWREVQTCVEATTSHTTLRIQFYPDPGSPTVEIDDVDVHQSLAINGSFENGGGPWTPYPDAGSNYSVYSDTEPGDAALSGSHIGATNAASAGGGIYEDSALATTPGATVCGSAWLRTEGTATGASGSFALWLTGGSDHEAGVAGYSGLGNGDAWTEVQTCAEATTAHDTLRMQFYPAPGAPTVEIDDVDVHQSLAVNGSFENGGEPWTAYPGTGSDYQVWGNGQYVLPVAPAPAPAPTTPSPATTTPSAPDATPLPVSDRRHALRIAVSLEWRWNRAETRLVKILVGHLPGATHLLVRCAGRGCPRPVRMSVSGARRLRRRLHGMEGHRYRVGDRVFITLTAPGYRPERAEVMIRWGRKPRIVVPRG